MSIAQRIRLTLIVGLFALAYGTGMKMLFSLSTVAPFITTLVLAVGTVIAWRRMKRTAKREGSKPTANEESDLSLITMMKIVIGAGIAYAVCIAAAEISAGALLAVIETIVFGFMLSFILVLESARVEISTRRSLGLA